MLILVVAICISLCVQNVMGDVSCTAGTFVAGSQGVVRCDFGIDVTKDQHDFNVVRYDYDISLDSRKSLLACNWFNDQMTCPLKATGYLFDNRVDSTLTLVIPVVDKSMTGLYRCQLVNKPTNNIDMRFCNLTVIEVTRNVDTTDSGSLSQGNTGQAVVVLVICLVILSLLFVTAMGVLRYVRKSFHFVRKNDYCPWIPDFWTLERFHRGEARMEVDAEEMHAADPASLVERHQEDVPLQVQPDATTQPLIPPRTRAASTNVNDDKDVTLNIENINDGEADTGATTSESATNTKPEKDISEAEGKSHRYIADDPSSDEDDSNPDQFLSTFQPLPAGRGNEG